MPRIGTTLTDLLENWRKPDGSFRSRRLLLGWDNVPMHRWAQAQMFRSLCFLLATAAAPPAAAGGTATRPPERRPSNESRIRATLPGGTF